MRTDAETQTQRRRDTDTKTQTPDAGAVTKNNADIESPTKSRCKVDHIFKLFMSQVLTIEVVIKLNYIKQIMTHYLAEHILRLCKIVHMVSSLHLLI